MIEQYEYYRDKHIEDILNMNNHQLNRLLCEKINGWKEYQFERALPLKYSEDIKLAWEARQWILDYIGGVQLERFCDDQFPEMCEIFNGISFIRVWAKNTPEAISRCLIIACVEDLPNKISIRTDNAELSITKKS